MRHPLFVPCEPRARVVTPLSLTGGILCTIFSYFSEVGLKNTCEPSFLLLSIANRLEAVSCDTSELCTMVYNTKSGALCGKSCRNVSWIYKVVHNAPREVHTNTHTHTDGTDFILKTADVGRKQ